ncbi:MAG: serine/threonine protein phosphatase [Candidatus Parabeggiatoa sp. nov. 3]|nr:MAG: serine/threonine protein phosphatase [Gammaproteobacteria bacterium]RKZ64065.1 MAG: serine/threonine protein phosphatase [Gammaproteobacteria bacterium]RKZ84738.1 MAG: serine/threonine protein phosphatase [Gammaproteobacteria bacterium]HEW98552.1 response regulator [Beggiatoa sp.]
MNDTVDISNSNILVVDDTPANLRLLIGILREVGYKVRPANNGPRALTSIEKESPSLILLDIMMPNMDGYQVCEHLKAHEETREIPVIFISALNETFDKVKAFSVGGVDYITKPFQAEEVLARVETHLKLHELQRQLKKENLRMRAELEVSRRLQQMLLPTEKELKQIDGLDIAGFMAPAEEVGGDYYDVLQHQGRILFGIGDVTGHGLESGALAIMVQSSIRTLLANNETDPVKFFSALNQMVFHNVERMNVEKSLTLALVDYQDKQLYLSGQHEEMIVVRQGKLELIDTMDLGFPIGLDFEIADFVKQTSVPLNAGDVVVLYTDGITEAENIDKQMYGLERLCEVIRHLWQQTAHEIQQAVIEDVRQFIGEQKVYDDITLLVLKQQ